MIQINTDRGQFNITESLMEAIQLNNPEILSEAKSSEYFLLKDRIIKYGIENLPDDIEQEISNLESKDEQKDIRNYIKKQKHQLKTHEKRQNNVQNDDNLAVTDNQLNDETKNDEVVPLKIFIESEDLHQQIKDAERMATGIIKRAKRVIHTSVGLVGSHTSSTPSKFKGGKRNVGANNNQNLTTSTAQQPTKEPAGPVDTSIRDYYKSSSGADRRVASDMKLMIGGFKFSPLFGDLNSSMSGKALKYYKSAQKVTKNSYIDDMINQLVLLKGNPSKFDKETDKTKTEFMKMAYSYLHNVVYKLEINDEKKFSSIVNALRLDNALNDLFDVTNVNTVQLFDTKEQVISFKNKKSGIISMIIVAVPMFAHGKEIWNNLKPIWGHLQNLKG